MLETVPIVFIVLEGDIVIQNPDLRKQCNQLGIVTLGRSDWMRYFRNAEAAAMQEILSILEGFRAAEDPTPVVRPPQWRLRAPQVLAISLMRNEMVENENRDADIVTRVDIGSAAGTGKDGAC